MARSGSGAGWFSKVLDNPFWKSRSADSSSIDGSVAEPQSMDSFLHSAEKKVSGKKRFASKELARPSAELAPIR